MTAVVFLLAGLSAVTDWVAVARQRRRVERIAKPLTLTLLILAAGFADLGPAKPWLLAALVFGLGGDVALFRAADAAADRWFLLGLASFLLGHLCYLTAFLVHGVHPIHLVAGGLVVLGIAGLTVTRVLQGARRSGGLPLALAVAGYAAALATMSVLGVGTGSALTAVGVVLFLGSDLVLAWHRFVQPLLRGPVLVIVTYHLAQLLIIAGLLR